MQPEIPGMPKRDDSEDCLEVTIQANYTWRVRRSEFGEYFEGMSDEEIIAHELNREEPDVFETLVMAAEDGPREFDNTQGSTSRFEMKVTVGINPVPFPEQTEQ